MRKENCGEFSGPGSISKTKSRNSGAFSLVAGHRHNSELQITRGTLSFLDSIPPQEMEISLREESVS